LRLSQEIFRIRFLPFSLKFPPQKSVYSALPQRRFTALSQRKFQPLRESVIARSTAPPLLCLITHNFRLF
jgi:hypothetical protein